jgi:hypothetical protein
MKAQQKLGSRQTSVALLLQNLILLLGPGTTSSSGDIAMSLFFCKKKKESDLCKVERYVLNVKKLLNDGIKAEQF